MNEKSLIRYLTRHAACQPVRFHVPGHKGAAFFHSEEAGEGGKFLGSIADYDLTEIPGSDNLFDPSGPIREIERRYADFYGAEESFLSVNGATLGVLSSIVSQVPAGKSLLLPRASHRSAYGALRISGAKPVFLPQYVNLEFGIPAPVTKEDVSEALDRNPDIAAVFITSPDYFGTIPDLPGIAEEVHRRGLPLLVDQAHGAHLILTDPALSAEKAGADIIIDSTHKTLSSFTQSAVIHRNGERADRESLVEALEILESSSPSYILMASLEENIDSLEKSGRALAEEWRKNISSFRTRAGRIPGLKMYEGCSADPDDPKIRFDRTKLAFSFVRGIPGAHIEKMLRERNVWAEMAAGNLVLLETGIGNTRQDYEKLTDALSEIASKISAELPESCLRPADAEGSEGSLSKFFDAEGTRISIPEFVGIPKKREKVFLSDAAGRIASSMLIPYPPGIPAVCPGERLTERTVRELLFFARSGGEVLGVDAEGKIRVGKV